MPDNLMDLLREIETGWIGVSSPVKQLARRASVLVQKQQAAVDLIGTVILCPECDGTRTRKRDGVHACCRLGHARDCQCALCQWIRAGQRWEQKEIAQRSEIERLKRERDEALADYHSTIGMAAVRRAHTESLRAQRDAAESDAARLRERVVALEAAMNPEDVCRVDAALSDASAKEDAESPKIYRDESTPEARAIWADVEKAASRDAPHAPTEAEAADLGRPESGVCPYCHESSATSADCGCWCHKPKEQSC